MWSDLRDAWNWIQRLVWRVERLESGAFLENSSITNGRFRIIGGLLRVDSGGRVEVIGEWRFFGPGAITGDVVAEGKWTQNGDWEFNGNGRVAGNADLTGTIRAMGGGKVVVQGGGGDVVLDSSFGSPRVQLGAAQIEGGSSSITLTSGSATVYIMDNTIRIAAMATRSSADVGLPAGSVYADSLGRLFRVI